MPVSYKLGPVFNKRELNNAVKGAIEKTLTEFVEYVKKEQQDSVPSGKVYRGKSFRKGKKVGGVKSSGKGRGFHRASAKGQRPAIDTGRLNKSTKAKRTGAFKGEVTTIAKSKGFDYAEQLQEKMGRRIQDDRDAKVGEKMMQKNGEKALLDLIRKRLNG